MKIIQQAEPKFEPITIVLETREEAKTFWEIMNWKFGEPKKNMLAAHISDFFSNEAKL